MPLFDVVFNPAQVPIAVTAVQAGGAAEMVSRLNNAVAGLIAQNIAEAADFKLAGAGSGLNWEAWFVLGDPEGGVELPLEVVRFVASEAGNPVEATLRLNQQLAAAFAALSPGTEIHLYKVEVAGSGDGPTYMAVAVYAIGLIPQ